MPPSTPKKAPNRKPLRRPICAINIEAGNIIKAVPKNIEAMGSVESVGVFAICAPAKPPMVMTMTETVWKSDWELAKINTWRCMVF